MEDGRVVSKVCVVRQSSGGSCLEWSGDVEPDWTYSKTRRISEGWGSSSYILRVALTVCEIESRAVRMTDLTSSTGFLRNSENASLEDGCPCPFGLLLFDEDELSSYFHKSVLWRALERWPSRTESVSLNGRESKRCSVRRVAQVLCKSFSRG